MSNEVASILGRWRSAERRLEASADDQTDRPALIEDVIHAWLAYQAASTADGPDEIVLIADATRRYVAATDNAAALFGRDPVGLRIDDVSRQGPDDLESTWGAFTSSRSMEGEYDVVASADRVVRVRFRAFANVPLPGLFASHIVVVPAADELGGLSDPLVRAPA